MIRGDHHTAIDGVGPDWKSSRARGELHGLENLDKSEADGIG